MKIPSPSHSKLEYLYLETRKRNVVIVVGTLLNYQVDWSADDEKKESIQKAIQFLLDILAERRVILERRVGIAFLKWNIVRCIDTAMIARQKGNFTIYSWKGTYSSSSKK